MHKARHALITGGSSGIGLAMAEELITKGYHITLISRDETKLKKAATLLEKQKVNDSQHICHFACDVSDAKALERIITEVANIHETIDLLVTSAGTAIAKRFEDTPFDEYKQLMETNYLGTIYTVKACHTLLQKSEDPGIIFIASGASLLGFYGYSAYAPSKYAIKGLYHVLRSELTPQNIHVMIAYPPDTDTPQLAEENRTKPAITKAISGNAGIYSAPYVAEKIIKAYQKRRHHITISAPLFILHFLTQGIMPLCHYVIQKTIRKHA